MADPVPWSQLGSRLASIAGAHGLGLTSGDPRRFNGTREAITSKWLLGGRKIVYHVSCDVDEASHTVHFRESAVESSWGIPPPTFTVERTTARGARVDESRVDRSVGGGGGRLDYGALREEIEKAVKDGGWRFVLDIARPW